MGIEEEERIQQALEERLGITEKSRDCPPDRGYCGGPTSDYYLDENPDYEDSHRRGDEALAALDKYLKISS